MPTYEYICDGCGCEFERFQSITAKSVRVCPKCGKRKVKRLIGRGAGIIFKGSGFYETDYRSESYKKGAESEKKSREKKTEKKDANAEGKGSKSEGKAKSEGKDNKKTA